MTDKRVAITGLGVISAAGIGIDELWSALLEGRSGVKPLSQFAPGKFPCKIVGQVEGFSARKCVPKSYRKSVKLMARDIELAIGAADLAFRDAGITTIGIDGDVDIESSRLGCNIGAGLISCELEELGQAAVTAVVDGKFDLKAWGEAGIENLTPLWLLKYLPNMLSCHVTIIHGAKGPSNCITCADASGQMGVGESSLYIKRGSADVVVTGGAESKITPIDMMRQLKMNRLTLTKNESPETAMRPFDADASGSVIGEAGGLLILEDFDRAQARGAKIYAEVAGFGGACDPAGMDITKPNAGNLSHAVINAIKNAGLALDDIDAIFAYGMSHPAEDGCEAAEWKNVFGESLSSIPACAITGATGQMFAGGGAVQTCIAAKAVSEGVLPATVNFQTPAAGVELNLSNQSRPVAMKNVVVASFGTGGQSGACVLRRVDA